MTNGTNVKKRVAAGAAVVAVAGLGGVALGTLPTNSTSVTRTADEITPSGLYNSAQKSFAARKVTDGLESIKRMLAITANDPDALTLQAVWADQEADAATRDAALRKLSTVRPTAAGKARNLVEGVTSAAALVPSTSPVSAPSGSAIVILGMGLRANGSMAPELINRLKAGLDQAEMSPQTPIFVTGGLPKKGITEAGTMKKWLISKGVSESRITTEDKSTSTVTNAQNTTEILRMRGVSQIVLVTSPNHIRRGAADFAGAGTKVVGAVTTSTDLSRYSKPLTGASIAGIRYEATRAANIPVTKGASDILPDTGPGLIGDIADKLMNELMQGNGSKGGAAKGAPAAPPARPAAPAPARPAPAAPRRAPAPR
ncbi:MAG: YdcF family protein [Gordonia sp. (in: high G+C Gram-positive bacteria)]|uniref:YdcF family protein n=1 Tax=Gordonia sp. (in: high G+C Gram-positive bacteria) TaxID=84139 RepID=UPI0039E3298D